MKLSARILLAFAVIALTQCTKDPVPSPSPTPVVTKPIPPRTQLLIGKTWQAMEVNNLSTCTNTHYVRGGSGNTGASYDPLRFTFYADSTGTHTDTQGNTYPITWKFVANDSQRMTITVIASTPVTYTWNMVEIAGNKFTQTTAINSSNVLTSATYVPTTNVTVAAPTLTRTQMLTAKTWKVEEVYSNVSCTNTHYLSGGAGNPSSPNYGLLRFTFNSNGTGSTTDTQGNNFTTTWAFTSSDERNLQITVNGSTPVVYNWNQVEITPGVMYQTTAMGTTSSNSLLNAAKWITIP
jgi:hypothetical protein